jgi:MFS transporter, UMF1 family
VTAPTTSSTVIVRKRGLIPAWISFDFGNSAFAVIMVTLVLPIYFGNVIVTDGRGDLYWGIAMSISMLIVALTGPILGAIADSTKSKKRFLIAFSLVTILCTAALAFVQPGMIALAMGLFILANAGFEGGIVFYNAYLPEITSEDRVGRISGYGFAAGYIGSFAIILLVSDLLTANKISESFLITAAFFLVFALPLFLVAPPAGNGIKRSVSPVKAGFTRTIETIRNIRKYKNVARFLLAFFIYNDAILTVIGFSGRYAKNTLGFETADLIKFFIMIQLIAAISSYIFGFITDKQGPKRTIVITLMIWCVVSVASYFATDAGLFYGVGALAAIALGSSQSASRSMMAKLTPPDKTTEFFGFYDGFCGKASAVFGPLIFGVMSNAFGQREAVLSLIVFFIVGLLLIRKVSEPRLQSEEARLSAVIS